MESTTTADETATDDQAEVEHAARYVEIAGWFVIVGATMTTLGFLLPWSRVVIGAASADFDHTLIGRLRRFSQSPWRVGS